MERGAGACPGDRRREGQDRPNIMKNNKVAIAASSVRRWTVPMAILAVLVLVVAFGLWIWSRFITLAPEAEDAVTLVALAALIQVALGIATLLMVVPIPLAVAHQAGGFLLLTAVLWALRRLPRSGA